MIDDDAVRGMAVLLAEIPGVVGVLLGAAEPAVSTLLRPIRISVSTTAPRWTSRRWAHSRATSPDRKHR